MPVVTAHALGTFSGPELGTTDQDAAKKFYTALFGWQYKDTDMGPMGTYFMYGRNGRMLGGMMNVPPGMSMPPNWCYYVSVKDTKATAEVARANGGTIINGPMEVPGGDWVAQGIQRRVHARDRHVEVRDAHELRGRIVREPHRVRACGERVESGQRDDDGVAIRRGRRNDRGREPDRASRQVGVLHSEVDAEAEGTHVLAGDGTIVVTGARDEKGCAESAAKQVSHG